MIDVASRAENGLVDPQSLGAVLANSDVIAVAAIRKGRIVFTNPAFQALFHATGSLNGVLLKDIVTDIDSDRLAEALATCEHTPTTFFGMGRRGTDLSFDVELNLESGVLAGEPSVIAFASDITERHRSEEQLSYLAYTDALTGLANRALFADRLHQAMLGARRYGAVFAVLMVDLDGFKAINDTYGHDAGDAVLQFVAQRFQTCIRESDTLARLGGDEFAVLLPRLTTNQDAASVAERMIAVLKDPLDLGAHQVGIGTSIGIAVYPEHASAVDPLLAAADTALYRAKRAGKNRFQWATGRSSADALAVPPLTWSVAHSVGIKEIDDQHAHLAGLIDALSTALKENASSDRINAGLNELVSYAELHFAMEERLMTDYQVESLPRHRGMHRRLLDDLKNLAPNSDAVSISLILRYLQEWLLRHVDTSDKELGRALIAKGLH